MSHSDYYRPCLRPISYIPASLHNPVAILFGFSDVTIEDYELSRLNFASHARKDLQNLMDGLVENLAEARAARWVLELRRQQ